MPIGGFIADFACLEAKLIVELDGGQHADRKPYDSNRSRILEREGFRTLPFRDNEVFQELDAVLDRIVRALNGSAPIPTFPRRRGKEADSAS